MPPRPRPRPRSEAWDGSRPAYELFTKQPYRRPRPLPRTMRSPELRANDPRLAATERARAEREIRDAQARQYTEAMRQQEQPPLALQGPMQNQFSEAGGMALEYTGLPAVRRSASAFTRGDLREGAAEGAWGALGVAGMATLVPRSPRGALRPMPEAPRYRPTNASGETVATEQYPFGFLQDETPAGPRLRTNQFYPVDETVDYGDIASAPTPEPAPIPTADLIGTQQGIKGSFLNPRPNEPITAYRGADGRPYIIDGHHRAAGALARGEPEIPARVFEPPRVTPPAEAPAPRIAPDADVPHGGTRRYETPNSIVLISDSPGGFREVKWDVAPDNVGDLPLAARASLEREGIESAMAALVRDAAENPNARYYFQPDNPALARRYARMADDLAAEHGYTVRHEDGVIELWPTREVSRPLPSDATRGGGASLTTDGGNSRPPPAAGKSYTRKPPRPGGFLLPGRTR